MPGRGYATAGVRVEGGVPEADIRAMFEQQPFLDGKQLVQRRFALAQTQFLHLPPPLQRQHCGILSSQTYSNVHVQCRWTVVNMIVN
jgi:hypothetical protein